MQALGFDPIWFGIVLVTTISIGLISPPVGMNVFVINSIARDVKLTEIYRGVLPFVGADLMRILALCLFPALALWLWRSGCGSDSREKNMFGSGPIIFHPSILFNFDRYGF